LDIFRVKRFGHLQGQEVWISSKSRGLDIFRVKRFGYLPSKYREPLSQWHSDTCWNIWILHNNMVISRWVWQYVMCAYCGDPEIQDTKYALWALSFSQQCRRGLGSAVMWCCVRVSGSAVMWCCVRLSGSAVMWCCVRVSGSAVMWCCVRVSGSAVMWCCVRVSGSAVMWCCVRVSGSAVMWCCVRVSGSAVM